MHITEYCLGLIVMQNVIIQEYVVGRQLKNIPEASNSVNNEEVIVTKLALVFVQFQRIEPLHKMRDCGLQIPLSPPLHHRGTRGSLIWKTLQPTADPQAQAKPLCSFH